MSDTPMQWGDLLSDEECLALSSLDPDLAGGDAEAEPWGEGVTYLYIFDEPTDVDDLTFPPGQYIRHVHWKTEQAWAVDGDAEAYVQAIEDRWVAYENAPTDPCGECGAKAHEECVKPGCQGEWR